MIVTYNNVETYNLSLIGQYEDIPYADCICCPNCYYAHDGGTYASNLYYEMMTDAIIGYTETHNGELMLIRECKHCGQQYRFHFLHTNNMDDWKEKAAYACHCVNHHEDIHKF